MALLSTLGINLGSSLFHTSYDFICQKRFIDLDNIFASLFKKLNEALLSDKLVLDFPPISTQPSVVNNPTG